MTRDGMTEAQSIVEAAKLLAERVVTAEQLVSTVLRRIEETEPIVHAYASVLAARALESARRADEEMARGRRRGPLHGIPLAVKDVFWTRDTATEAGSRLLAEFRPREDSAAVERLLQAGAVLVGKLVTHEFACGQNVPPTRNAWNADHYRGGSSAGAGVAVALGTTLGALGTDAGGSVRIPAALNGVVGLKPTYGRTSRFGVTPPSGSLDHVGIVARTVEDCAVLLEHLAGPDARDPSSIDVPVERYAEALDGDPLVFGSASLPSSSRKTLLTTFARLSSERLVSSSGSEHRSPDLGRRRRSRPQPPAHGTAHLSRTAASPTRAAGRATTFGPLDRSPVFPGEVATRILR